MQRMNLISSLLHIDRSLSGNLFNLFRRVHAQSVSNLYRKKGDKEKKRVETKREENDKEDEEL